MHSTQSRFISRLPAVHRIMRSLGRELKRVPRPLAYALDKQMAAQLPALLAFLKLTQPNFKFVQVGANDGVLQDPLHAWIVKFDLSGVMIEPQPEMCDKLRQLYADRPSVSVVNAAVSDTNGTRSLFRVPTNNASAEWMKGSASFNRRLLEAQLIDHPKDLDAIEELTVRTVTPSTVLSETSIPKVDVLVVDVEGFDFEILKLFDVANTRPAVVQYEHRHLASAVWEESLQLLLSAGYLVSYNFEDTLACRADLFPINW